MWADIFNWNAPEALLYMSSMLHACKAHTSPAQSLNVSSSALLCVQGDTVLVRLRQDAGQLHFSSVEGSARPRHAHVPRWHFDMVQDALRNTAYEQAIRRAVELKRAAGAKEVVVLDMGAGSGILSLMAARLGLLVTVQSCVSTRVAAWLNVASQASLAMHNCVHIALQGRRGPCYGRGDRAAHVRRGRGVSGHERLCSSLPDGQQRRAAHGRRSKARRHAC